MLGKVEGHMTDHIIIEDFVKKVYKILFSKSLWYGNLEDKTGTCTISTDK